MPEHGWVVANPYKPSKRTPSLAPICTNLKREPRSARNSSSSRSEARHPIDAVAGSAVADG